MIVYHDIDSFKALKLGVTTIGIFDGVHIGHKKILKSIVDKAKEIGGESVVVTFWPHPRLVLANDTSLKLLNTIEEKIKLIETKPSRFAPRTLDSLKFAFCKCHPCVLLKIRFLLLFNYILGKCILSILEMKFSV